MKILIVTNYPGSFPYIQELGNWLSDAGCHVAVLDLPNLTQYRWESGAFIKSGTVLENKFVRRMATLPKVGKFFRKNPINKWLSTQAGGYDVINVHYTDPYYSDYAASLNQLGKRLISVVWGSDFYRIDDAGRTKQRVLYDLSDKIIFGNPGVASAFFEHFGDYQKKSRVVGFGIGKLELLKSLMETVTKADIRAEFSIPEHSICVTCGYNGSDQQQHEWMIEKLSDLPDNVKQEICILMPLTYGASKQRVHLLTELLKQSGIRHKMFTGFMSDEAASKLRIVTDIAINAQSSDSLSASLQEHMYAQNILMAAKWLPYEIFENLGVKLYRFDKSDFLERFQEIFYNYAPSVSAVKENTEKIYQLSAWKHRIRQWVQIFEEEKGNNDINN